MPLRLLDCVATISTRAHRSGLSGISAGRFFFFDLTNFAQTFGETKHALKYTPRRMSRLPGSTSVAVVEADQSVPLHGEVRKRTGAIMDVDEPEGASSLPSRPFAPLPRSTPGRWVSCLRVLNLANGVSEAVVELTENTAAFSVAALNFSDKGHVVAKLGEEGGYASMTYIVIGTAKGLSSPTSSSGSGYALETYCSRGGKLSHLHSTEIEDVPLCMVEFQEKLLVGIGRSLRLYDLGRKRLLRKCELRGFPNHITKLAVSGGRVFVGDVADSVTFVKYDKLDNTLKVFAEEQRPRLVLLFCLCPSCPRAPLRHLLLLTLYLSSSSLYFSYADSLALCAHWTKTRRAAATALATCFFCACLTRWTMTWEGWAVTMAPFRWPSSLGLRGRRTEFMRIITCFRTFT